MEVADAGWDGNTDIRWGKKLNNLIDGHRDMDEDLFGWPPLFLPPMCIFQAGGAHRE